MSTQAPSLSKWRMHVPFLFLPFPLCRFLPAWLPAGETQVSGVVLKVELAPCLINDWHLCQSIHSATTACNKSHLAGRWADPQASLQSQQPVINMAAWQIIKPIHDPDQSDNPTWLITALYLTWLNPKPRQLHAWFFFIQYLETSTFEPTFF